MEHLNFVRSLKLKCDEEIFDSLYGAENLDDEDFKALMLESLLRLVGVCQK